MSKLCHVGIVIRVVILEAMLDVKEQTDRAGFFVEQFLLLIRLFPQLFLD